MHKPQAANVLWAALCFARNRMEKLGDTPAYLALADHVINGHGPAPTTVLDALDNARCVVGNLGCHDLARDIASLMHRYCFADTPVSPPPATADSAPPCPLCHAPAGGECFCPPPESISIKAAVQEVVRYAEKMARDMDDPTGDGSGRDSRPPTRDDWNALHSEVLHVLGPFGRSKRDEK